MEDNRKYREEIEKLKSSYNKSPKRKYSIRKVLHKVSKLVPVILLIWFLAAVGIFIYALKFNHWVIGKESLISVLPPSLKIIGYGFLIVPIISILLYAFDKSIQYAKEDYDSFTDLSMPAVPGGIFDDEVDPHNHP